MHPAARPAQPDALRRSDASERPLHRQRARGTVSSTRSRSCCAEARPHGSGTCSSRTRSADAQQLDLTYAQDLALAPYGAVRLNEFYVSQYVDHTPLSHPTRGMRGGVAAEPGGGRPQSVVRHRLAAQRRVVRDRRAAVPWARESRRSRDRRSSPGAAGPPLAARALDGRRPRRRDLHSSRAQASARDSSVRSSPIIPRPRPTRISSGSNAVDRAAGSRDAGFEPTEGRRRRTQRRSSAPRRCLSARSRRRRAARDCSRAPWRHEERDEQRRAASFFHGADGHVVLRAKELRVLRPHGHMLRTGRHLTPDETALTSTAWMGGVFHSMVTQGHVSINRFLSTVHSYLGLFRSHGQRVFVELGGAVAVARYAVGVRDGARRVPLDLSARRRRDRGARRGAQRSARADACTSKSRRGRRCAF